MAEWWLSSRRMTVWAKDDDGTVVATAPVTRWALGKSLASLVKWLKQQGGFEWAQIGDANG